MTFCESFIGFSIKGGLNNRKRLDLGACRLEAVYQLHLKEPEPLEPVLEPAQGPKAWGPTSVQMGQDR
ncbi:hypothetical protein [Gracilinema caldarium]|uniref:hypothetical protein n=1 Tax=Gracilinema caldarium TaxID=215591 RepID=UPI0003129332|nr:hypothetical protein [Gracilinema caldarium]